MLLELSITVLALFLFGASIVFMKISWKIWRMPDSAYEKLHRASMIIKKNNGAMSDELTSYKEQRIVTTGLRVGKNGQFETTAEISDDALRKYFS